MDSFDWPYNYAFEDLANEVQWEGKDPDIDKILNESQFRQLIPLKPKPQRTEESEHAQSSGTPPWEAYDEGGSHPVDW